MEDHDYFKCSTSDYVTAIEICEKCVASLHLSENEEHESEHYKLIRMKSRERATLKVLNEGNINTDTLLEITNALEHLTPLPFVDCEEREMRFTHRVVSFYLTTRTFFIMKQGNMNDCIKKETTREKKFVI
ncbi:hypothetical protein TSAR_015911 [Trichomalopsis sarcophagae]|uniref:Uncharacterized protein n=1 Tax=Trichomalopsis sarcophagae TaxID=543379 RepID=A0A232EF05_9HYME|nr:hypothetical protein TSAR_015911 [Trichomalopsis sarcophagae]